MKKKSLGLIAVGLTGLLSAAVFAQTAIDGVRVGQLLKARLPRTQVSAIDCTKLNGLCEVVAGKTLFYTDSNARYLFVGRLYDMESRQDLTAAKLLEINPDMLLGGNPERDTASGEPEGAAMAAQLARAAVPGGGGGGRVTQPAAGPGQAQRQGLTRLDLSGLSPAGGIVWGKSSGKSVTIFTDFRCGYCRALAATLEQMNVRVTERPISILGSRDVADRVYCSRDKARAVRDAYAGIEVEGGKCDTSGLDANERFAREHGFMGTPVIVRGDGAVLEGYRPRQFLEQWLNGA